MKLQTHCFTKEQTWYYRKRIPKSLNAKTPLYRKSLKKLLGKKRYYTAILDSTLFNIISIINTNVEILFLDVEKLTLAELDKYTISLVKRYAEEAAFRGNDYINNIGTKREAIEDKRFNSLSYFDQNGVEFGGHTPEALTKEYDELMHAFNTDSIQRYREKAKQILSRQDIISKEELSKIPEEQRIEFEKYLVKKEIDVIYNDRENYYLATKKERPVSKVETIEPAQNAIKNNLEQEPTNDDWDIILKRYLLQSKSKRTDEIILTQFRQIMCGNAVLGIKERNLRECTLDDINIIKSIYQELPQLNHKEIKGRWREDGILAIIEYAYGSISHIANSHDMKDKKYFDVDHYRKRKIPKSLIGGLNTKIKTIVSFITYLQLSEPKKYGQINRDLWKRLSIKYSDLNVIDKQYNNDTRKRALHSEYINKFLFNRYLKEQERIEGQALRNFTRHTKSSPHVFWSVALGIFTGARAEELAQLQTKDIKKRVINNIPLFYIELKVTDALKQSLKNDASERFIPISKYLIDLGFLNYIQGRMNQKAKYLFELEKNKNGKHTAFQKSFNKDFKSFVTTNYTEHEGKLPTFHDLRSHFVSRYLNGEDSDDKYVNLKKLIGHTKKDLHKDVTIQSYFRENKELDYAKNLVDNIDFRIDTGYNSIKLLMEKNYKTILQDIKLKGN